MKSLHSFVDQFPRYLPSPVRERLRFLRPVYDGVRTPLFRILPERIQRTPWGPKIVVDPSHYVERSLASGDFESEFIDYFVGRVGGQSYRFADVGANIGFFSLLFRQVSAEGSQIDAFEPLPDNRRRLSRNLELNDAEVTVNPVGLSDEAGTYTLSVSDSSPGEASIASRLYSSTPSKTVEADFVTLDEFYADAEPPDVLKIDVEGAEVKVLRGGTSVLRSATPELFVEIHPPILQDMDDDIDDLRRLLADAGYENVYHIEGRKRLSLDQLSEFEDHESTHLHVW